MSNSSRRAKQIRQRESQLKRRSMQRSLRAEPLEDRMLLAGDLGITGSGETPFTNPLIHTDVNGDLHTSPIDALIIIDKLNTEGTHSLYGSSGEGEEGSPQTELVDVNGDNQLSPADALLVINRLNAEGEPDQDDIVDLTLTATDAQGNDINGTQIQTGDRFTLTASLQDLRGFQAQGVFAAFLDVAANNSVVFGFDFGETQLIEFSQNISNVGTFTITFDGQTTAPINLVGNLADTTQNMRNALDALPNVEPGDIRLTHVPVLNGNSFRWEATFFQNLGRQDVPMLSVDTSQLPPTGNVTSTVVERFPADISNPNTFRKAFTPIEPYNNSFSAKIDPQNLNEVSELGGSGTVGGLPDNTAVYPFVSATIIATSPGLLEFSGNPAEETPSSDVLVLGSNVPVPVSMVNYPDAPDEIIQVTIIKPVDAFDDAFTVDEDQDPTILDVLSNDVVVTNNGNKVVSAVTQGNQGGVVSINNGGANITYFPPHNYFGQETFSYTLSDGDGLFDTATVTITVDEVNDDPVAEDDSLIIDEDAQTVTIDVLANDSITPDEGIEETLSITSVSSQIGAQVSFNGVVSYTPPEDYFGTDVVTYTISDGRGGTATAAINITINPVNDDPVAVDDGPVDVQEDSLDNPLQPLDNDSVGPDNEIPFDQLSITSVGDVRPGAQVTIVDGTSINYSPPADFFGSDSFTYTISDNNGGSAEATFFINVLNVNDDPMAIDDFFNVDEDSEANSLSVLTNDLSDPDPTEELKVISATQPQVGGTTSVPADGGSVIFTPTPGFIDTAEFTYTISDGNGGTDTATVQVTVDPLQIPRARADRAEVEEDSSNNTINVLDNDLANDGFTLKVIDVDDTSTQGGSVTFTDNEVIYTPAEDFFGTDTFTYTINEFDAQGVANPNGDGPATNTITVTVNNVNDDPTAVLDTLTIDEDSGSHTINVLANDTIDPDEDETLTIITADSQSAQGGLVSFTSGTVSYTPPDDFFGTDSFTYTISDGNGGSDVGTVSITVANVNDDPIAGDDSITIDEDTTNSIDVLLNDSVGPANEIPEDTLSITGVSNVTSGAQVSIVNGTSISYTPPENFFGVATLNYTISDGNGGSDTATVSITINNVNDDPTANNDATLDNPKLILTDSVNNEIEVLSNDTFLPDPQETLTIISVTGAVNGTAAPSQDGSKIVYTPNQGVEDVFDTLTYTISDGNGGTDSATTTVKVVDFVPTDVSGYVYMDVSNDGVMNAGEYGLAGLTVTLSGSNLFGQSVQLETTTDRNGHYMFSQAVPGDYTLSAEHAMFTIGGKETVGNQGGSTSDDQISFSLDLFGSDGSLNMFGLLGVAAEYITIQELLSSNPDEGAIIALSNQGERYWFTMLEGWEGYSDVSATIADDFSYVDVTATNGSTTTQRVGWRHFHLMGTGDAGNVIRLKGSPAELGFEGLSEADGEQAEGEAYQDAVDEVMKAFA